MFKNPVRIGAVCGIIGSLSTAIIVNIHPRETVSGEHFTLHHLHEIASTPNWRFLHLVVVLCAPLLLFGLVVIAQTLMNTPARLWALLGGIFAAIGTAFAFGGLSVDGFAMKQIAENFVQINPTPGSSEYLTLQGFEAIQLAMFSMVTVVFYGVVPLLYGIAVLASAKYKAWVGLLPAILGIVGIVAGSYQLLFSLSLASILAFVATATLSNFWVAGMCISILRSRGKE